MKQRFSEEQIVQILREGEAAESKAEVWRKYGVSEWTYYRWRQRYGGLAESQARRLRELERENARLKRLVAEQALAQEALREALEKKGRR
ncbi:MAG: transposase [Chloroflexota bacterium]|nr:transposase [Chloroflexota bacterium]